MENRPEGHRTSVASSDGGNRLDVVAFPQWQAGIVVSGGDGDVLRHEGVKGEVRHR
jgi:hypothetical protein